jgi:signal transduction histidine kinase
LIEKKIFRLHYEDFKLNEAIKATLNILIGQAELQKVEIKCNLVARDYTVRLDLVRFQQVLINLLTNALKYSDGKGTIHVTNSVTRLSEASPEVEIAVSVKDNGIGISASD